MTDQRTTLDPQSAQDRIRAIVREQYAKCGGDKAQTLQQAEAIIVGETGLVTALVRAAVSAAIIESFRFALKTTREQLAKSLRTKSEITARFLDWPLAGGLLLRNATRSDLAAASKQYRQQAATMLVYADFLSSVAKTLRGAQCVGDVLTDQQLSRLMLRAEQARHS